VSRARKALFNVVVVDDGKSTSRFLKGASSAPQTHLKRFSSALQTRLKHTSNGAQTRHKRTSNTPQN